ncbi:MAG: transglutaminase domain-containing protein [Nitrososphaeraceae archaeon]|nr:transglutaminase domain-containing protein [Nitrososphaeraceae archaeon]
MVSINLDYLRRHSVPILYRSGVRYGRTKLWEPIPELYSRGFGDCKSLASALTAEYKNKGIKARPVYRWIPNNYGGRDFHVLVETPERNGYQKKLFEDPSRILGMGKLENRR